MLFWIENIVLLMDHALGDVSGVASSVTIDEQHQLNLDCFVSPGNLCCLRTFPFSQINLCFL